MFMLLEEKEKDNCTCKVIENKLKTFLLFSSIFPVVLYSWEIWSLRLREECRVMVFENRILRRIFPPMRDKNGEGSTARKLTACTVHII